MSVFGTQCTVKRRSKRRQNATHEAVSSTFSGLPVSDDHRFLDITELFEVFSQTVVCRVVWQTTHEQFRVGRVFLLYDRHSSVGFNSTLPINLRTQQKRPVCPFRYKLFTSRAENVGSGNPCFKNKWAREPI